MVKHEDYLNLSNLGNGAALELFDVELQKVLDNIVDENTKPNAVREVTLKIKIKPDEDREMAHIDVQASAKLAPVHPYKTQAFIGKRGSKGVCTEHNPKQLHAFREEPQEGKIVPMTTKEGKE